MDNLQPDNQLPAMENVAGKYRVAAQYGLYLGVYMGVFYLLGAFFPNQGLLKTLCSLANLAMFFIAYYMVKRYRDQYMGGYINFRQAWSFSFWLYTFTAIILSAFTFVHLQFLQPDFLADTMTQVLTMLEEMNYPSEQMDVLIDFGVPSAIQVTFVYLWFYIIGGALLSLINAAIVKKENLFQEPQQQA
ncbi:MAG: DUF4199 domain-containing protein [Bacteroidales bacterium]|nr:DUF4199 domain-containing protein [Bacteroidales bacterium]